MQNVGFLMLRLKYNLTKTEKLDGPLKPISLVSSMSAAEEIRCIFDDNLKIIFVKSS